MKAGEVEPDSVEKLFDEAWRKWNSARRMISDLDYKIKNAKSKISSARRAVRYQEWVVKVSGSREKSSMVSERLNAAQQKLAQAKSELESLEGSLRKHYTRTKEARLKMLSLQEDLRGAGQTLKIYGIRLATWDVSDAGEYPRYVVCERVGNGFRRAKKWGVVLRDAILVDQGVQCSSGLGCFDPNESPYNKKYGVYEFILPVRKPRKWYHRLLGR